MQDIFFPNCAIHSSVVGRFKNEALLLAILVNVRGFRVFNDGIEQRTTCTNGLDAKVRQRAYELYAEGGFQDGNAE